MFRFKTKFPAKSLIISDSADLESLALHCNSYNQTFSSFTVDCSARRQEQILDYLFVIKNSQTGSVVKNVSTSSARLTVLDLPSSTSFQVTVYSFQAGQRSNPVSIKTFTTRPGEKPLATMRERTEPSPSSPLGFVPILATFLLISLVLVLLIIGLVAVVRRRVLQARNSPSSQLELLSQKCDTEPHLSPDLIPKEPGGMRSVNTNDVVSSPPLH